MEILKIIEGLQAYSEDAVAYKLDSRFAHAVTEAVSLLVEQGERIAELEAQLTYARAERDVVTKRMIELESLNDQRRWIPVTERLPELIPCGAGTAYSEAVIIWTDGRKAMIAVWDGIEFLCAANYWEAEGETITHWMPLPGLPKEVKENGRQF